jgi:hypothetical protein
MFVSAPRRSRKDEFPELNETIKLVFGVALNLRAYRRSGGQMNAVLRAWVKSASK